MKYKLGEICEIVSGSTPKTSIAEYWDGDIKWITPAELTDESYIIEDSVRKLTELGVKKSGLTPFPAGTVILSSRAPIGKVAIAGCEMYCNQGFKNLICSDKINNKYLYWFLKGNTVFLNSLGRGATFKEISKGIVSDIEINVPDAESQNRAVSNLEKLSEIIKLRKNEMSELDNLIKARFVELFGDPVLNSLGWEKKRFDSLCENFDGRRKPITSTDRVEGPYPYYGASGVVDHVADYIFDEDILLVSEDGANLLARSTPIAFSVSGRVWVNNHAHVVKFDDFALQKYVEYYFAMISIEDYVTGSTQPKLNQAKLNGIMIPIPEKERIDCYLNFIKQVDKSKAAVQKSLDETQVLFDSLMQKYFG